jgi:hypothetical protein
MASYRLIQTATITSLTAAVTFSSIPQTFEDLLIMGIGRSDYGNNITNFRVRLNNDTGSFYYWYLQYSFNSTPTTNTNAKASTYGNSGIVAATDGVAISSPAYMYLSNYTNTGSNKAWQSLTGAEMPFASSTFYGAYQGSNNYAPTSDAAITTISLIPQQGTGWVAGTSYSLYGISN